MAVQSYWCLLVYRDSLLLCIKPAVWGLCVLSLPAERRVGLGSNKTCVDASSLMPGSHC